jgi:hypothetical protein
MFSKPNKENWAFFLVEWVFAANNRQRTNYPAAAVSLQQLSFINKISSGTKIAPVIKSGSPIAVKNPKLVSSTIFV